MAAKKDLVRLLLQAVMVVGALSSPAGAQIRPANPDTTPAARRVLQLLSELPSKPQHRVLSGQYIGLVDGIAGQPRAEEAEEGYRRDVESLHGQTGKWPAILGINFGRIAECSTPNRLLPAQRSPFLKCDGGTPDYAKTNQLLISYARAGGIISVTWHAPNPWTGRNAHDVTIGGAFSDLYTPGKPMFATWHKMLDDLAIGLTQLREAGVVVMFRPFHEQNGGWFWWGSKGGKAPSASEFARLWRDTFTYLTKTKKLDNLIWVFSPNRNGGDGDKAGVMGFDPGSSYYDVVGVSDYEDDNVKAIPYQELLATKKPIGLAEFGPLGAYAAAPSTKGRFDELRLLDILKKYPRLSFFMAWNGHLSLNSNRNANLVLSNPIIANRDDIARSTR